MREITRHMYVSSHATNFLEPILFASACYLKEEDGKMFVCRKHERAIISMFVVIFT